MKMHAALVMDEIDKLFPPNEKPSEFQGVQKPDFKLEVSLDVQTYLSIIKKVFATIRFKVYSAIRKELRERADQNFNLTKD